jgi:hypothetical protein
LIIINENDNIEFILYITKNGFLYKLYQILNIEKQCELKKFPIQLNDYKFYIKDNELYYNDKLVKTQKFELQKEYISYISDEKRKLYDPLNFHNFDENKSNWIRISTCDKNEFLAFIVNKYNFGMNISYYTEYTNYDHPVGIALKLKDDSCLIYKYNDEKP